MKPYGAKRAIADGAAILAGCALVALGLTLFTVPNDIAPGGVSGLATALAYVTRVPVGAWSLLLNVPVLLLGWWKLGFRPLAGTVAATLLLSILIDVFSKVVTPYTNNPLLAAVLGGVLMGAGMALVFIRGASTGGTDLISLLLNRAFPNVSVGMLLLIVDAFVVILAVLVFRDIEVALYSIVTIYVATRTVDTILQGVDHAKVIYVVTERGEAVRERLSGELELGVTVLDARGGYTHRNKQVLLVVVRRNAFAQTLARIKQTDGDAFLFVTNAGEVHGEGFKQ